MKSGQNEQLTVGKMGQNKKLKIRKLGHNKQLVVRKMRQNESPLQGRWVKVNYSLPRRKGRKKNSMG
jgi:hypothetical protein